jgi:HD-like signal output (HDOD) protein
MTVALSIGMAVAVLIVVAFVLQLPGKMLPADKKPKRREEVSSPGYERPGGNAETITKPFNDLVPDRSEPASSDIYKELRQHLRKGIDRIFDEKAVPPDERTKPFSRETVDPQVLKSTLEHLACLNQFRTEQVRLQRILNDPAVQMNDLSKTILSDPLMTTKILKMTNSSYFGIQQKIDSISHALMILGLQNIKNILYREGMRNFFETGGTRSKEAVAILWKHSNLVSICTQHFHDLFSGLNMGTLYTLGIVHDIGKLILMDIFRANQKAPPIGEDYPMDILVGEEDQLLGINHAVIGGCALEQWNFSALMVNVVQAHHLPSFIEAEPEALDQEMMKYALVLFLADQVAKLYADWNEGVTYIYPLRASYHSLVDKKKLLNIVLDTNFLSQLRASEMIATAESHDKF